MLELRLWRERLVGRAIYFFTLIYCLIIETTFVDQCYDSSLEKRRRVHRGWGSERTLVAWHVYKVRLDEFEESLKKEKSKSAKVANWSVLLTPPRFCPCPSPSKRLWCSHKLNGPVSPFRNTVGRKNSLPIIFKLKLTSLFSCGRAAFAPACITAFFH